MVESVSSDEGFGYGMYQFVAMKTPKSSITWPLLSLRMKPMLAVPGFPLQGTLKYSFS
jgi:hypothetical protein